LLDHRTDQADLCNAVSGIDISKVFTIPKRQTPKKSIKKPETSVSIHDAAVVPAEQDNGLGGSLQLGNQLLQ
jgi:hypothetical protein